MTSIFVTMLSGGCFDKADSLMSEKSMDGKCSLRDDKVLLEQSIVFLTY